MRASRGLHEIDPQSLLKRGGCAITAACQILFFHPHYMALLLQADPAALLEAPLKFAVLELSTGDVIVCWSNPAPAFDGLADLGKRTPQATSASTTSSRKHNQVSCFAFGY
jgi:uncharacterized protein (DUF302 family)